MFRITGLHTPEARRRHALAMTSALAAIAIVPATALADTAYEGETLSLSRSSAGYVFADSAASGGKALKIHSNASASRSASVSQSSVKLIARARGQQCSGAPQMTVSVDGSTRLTASVSATSYTVYSAMLSLPAGAHSVKVSYSNDYRSSGCDRNLIVDSVSLVAATTSAPAPAPTPAPTPAPDITGTSPTGPVTAPTAPIALKTGFESRAGSAWTSLSEEQSFLRDLDAASGRVSLSEIGRSGEGRPIQLITVGAPRTQAEIAAGTSVLFVCTQHGDEPAGREACLQAARDHAESSDATTVLIIPLANPDGFVHNTRHNATGVDVNRDHLALKSSEARAIAAVMRDYKPDALGDMHEYSASGASSVLFADASRLHRNVDPQIVKLTSTLHTSYARADVAGAGFSTGMYSSGSSTVDETVMRQQSALRHIPSLLVETPRLGTLSPLRRVKAQFTAIGATVRMVRDNTAELASTTAAAPQRAAAEGAAGNQRFYYTSPSVYSDTPPCGYRLTDSQYQTAQRALGLHGITAISANGSWTVSAAQASQPNIGLLLDSRSPRELTAGARLSC